MTTIAQHRETPDGFVDAAGAAFVCGYSVSWVQRQRRRGALAAYRVGRRVLFKVADLRALATPTIEEMSEATR